MKVILGFELIDKIDRQLVIKCKKCGLIFKRVRFKDECPNCNKELSHIRRSESQRNKTKRNNCFDKLSLDEFIKRLYSRRDDLEVLSTKYNGSHELLEFRCKKCNMIFSYPAYYAITGILCPLCTTKQEPKYVSNIENDVADFVSSVCSNKIIRNTTYPIFKELDIFIPDKNVALEVNGTYWHSSIFKNKNYHVDKSRRCEEKNIRLIHIWEYEWNNKRQRPILENIIKNAIGVNDKKIYARKCKIKIVNRTAELREFFDTNNIQGFRSR